MQTYARPSCARPAFNLDETLDGGGQNLESTQIDLWLFLAGEATVERAKFKSCCVPNANIKNRHSTFDIRGVVARKPLENYSFQFAREL